MTEKVRKNEFGLVHTFCRWNILRVDDSWKKISYEVIKNLRTGSTPSIGRALKKTVKKNESKHGRIASISYWNDLILG
jgi:hypothetical protein